MSNIACTKVLMLGLEISRGRRLLRHPIANHLVELIQARLRATRNVVDLVCGVWIRLGCGQEQDPLGSGTDPSGADGLTRLAKKIGKPGPPDPGGGGGSEAVLLDLGEGMLTTGLPVNVVTDSRKKIHLETNPFHATMNFFTDPDDWFEIKSGPGKRQPDITQEEGDALQAELAPGKVVDNGRLYLEIDKAGLQPGGVTSGSHYFIIDSGEIGIQIGGPYGTPVTVAWLTHEETVDTFQFTGTVIVWKRGDSPKDSRMIGCPRVGAEPYKVKVTVTR